MFLSLWDQKIFTFELGYCKDILNRLIGLPTYLEVILVVINYNENTLDLVILISFTDPKDTLATFY